MASLADTDRSTAISGCCQDDDPFQQIKPDPIIPISANEGLIERQLQETASYGQALLERHETYVAQAEARHAADSQALTDLSASVERLEAQNEQLRSENDGLAFQAKELAGALRDGETNVENLTNTLKDTQDELARMRVMAARADRMEQQLIQLEMEFKNLQSQVDQSAEDERQANARWHVSQRALKELQLQIDYIEAGELPLHQAPLLSRRRVSLI
ncbi:MAG: hypothetical protein Q9162_002380 [Coniocarpon cinnabarinum]